MRYSGISAVFGIQLALINVLVLLNRKRRSAPLPMENLAHRQVTVALPAYNDEESIGLTVEEFRRRREMRRAFVVSNNSTDGTHTLESKPFLPSIDADYGNRASGIGGDHPRPLMHNIPRIHSILRFWITKQIRAGKA